MPSGVNRFVSLYSATVDLPVAVTVDMDSLQTVDVQLINTVDGSVDGGLADTDVMILPVSLKRLGFTATTTATTITYTASSYSAYAPLEEEDAGRIQLVDTTDAVTFDVYRPSLWFGEPGQSEAGSVLFADAPGALPVHRQSDPAAADEQILLLHLHNASDNRVQLIDQADAEPTATTAPAITGTATVGSTLTATPGVWTGGVTAFRYQWLRDGKAIAGATTSKRVLSADDLGKRLSVRVSPVGHDVSATSAATGPVKAGTFSTVSTPKITGTAKVSATLTATVGAFKPAAKIAYQWLLNGRPIARATTSKLVVTPGMLGDRISVRIVASAAGYQSVTRTSAATGPVKAGTFSTVSTPKITGTAKVSATLTATVGAFKPAAKISYQWLLNGRPIAKATTSKLKVTTAMRGDRISVRIVASAPGYQSVTRTSAATAVVR